MPIFSQDLILDQNNNELNVLMNKGSDALIRHVNINKLDNDILQI